MSFTPAFNVSQSVDPTSFTINDVSTGSDGAITQRRIYLTTASNTTLVPTGTTTQYINFPLIDGASIALVGILPVDYALSITLQWLNVSNAVLYTLTQDYCFTANDEAFYFSLTTLQTSNPGVINNSNYFQNKSLLRLYIDSANQSIAEGNDVYKSQFCLDQAQVMINNSSFYFT